jgi:hypothetical protein
MFERLFRSPEERKLRTAKVVKAIDHGCNVQLLCADEWGLVSVYLDHKPFSLLKRVLKRAGVELGGASVAFDREIIQLELGSHGWRRQIRLR